MKLFLINFLRLFGLGTLLSGFLLMAFTIWSLSVPSSLPASLSASSFQPMRLPVTFLGEPIPSAILPCISLSGWKIEVDATASQKSKKFYLLTAYDDVISSNPLLPLTSEQDELIVIDSQKKVGCQRLIPQLEVKTQQIGSFMSTETAINLESQRYRRWIVKIGGKAQFERDLSKAATIQNDDFILSHEQVAALRKLNINLPTKEKKNVS